MRRAGEHVAASDRVRSANRARRLGLGYFFAFLACRFSFKVFCAGFFSMLFFAFLSLLAMS